MAWSLWYRASLVAGAMGDRSACGLGLGGEAMRPSQTSQFDQGRDGVHGSRQSLCVMGQVNKVSHVFTLGYVAEMLGEEWLFEVAEEMDTEHGQLWVVGVGEDGVLAFTDDGTENLKNLIAIHQDDPSIIEERRQALAAMIKPKTEESDEV